MTSAATGTDRIVEELAGITDVTRDEIHKGLNQLASEEQSENEEEGRNESVIFESDNNSEIIREIYYP